MLKSQVKFYLPVAVSYEGQFFTEWVNSFESTLPISDWYPVFNHDLTSAQMTHGKITANGKPIQVGVFLHRIVFSRDLYIEGAPSRSLALKAPILEYKFSLLVSMFSCGISWENLLKDQSNFPLMIILSILTTCSLDSELIF